MQIAVTGGTGFLGRYLVDGLAAAGHDLRCWFRDAKKCAGFEQHGAAIEWLQGELGHDGDAQHLVARCQAVVHAALYLPGDDFRGGEGPIVPFIERNVLGTLKLIEAARAAGVQRFVFISSCAVHEHVLPDRQLDETHPTYAKTHYGAHKAAIEQFVYSYGLGEGYPICAVRPCGIYGVARPVEDSKWFGLVRDVVAGRPVECRRGGKEIHAADVAQAVELLLSADGIAGQAYSCCDRYISEFEVATLARELSGSQVDIRGAAPQPTNQIDTSKIQRLGVEFGGRELLRSTIAELIKACA